MILSVTAEYKLGGGHGQSLLSAIFHFIVKELEELNVIMEVIFLQLDRMDVLIMSSRLSSAGSQLGNQKVVMMLY